MRENYRKSIASIERLPRFTTMNVIDGQAGLAIYASLIFYSLTIDNILNIIVLLILAGVAISMLSGENGILNQAAKASTKTGEAQSKEMLDLVETEWEMKQYSESDNDIEAFLTNKKANKEITDYEKLDETGIYKIKYNEQEKIIGKNLITFSIDGVEFKATQGMTWGEWMNNEKLSEGKFTDDAGFVNTGYWVEHVPGLTWLGYFNRKRL